MDASQKKLYFLMGFALLALSALGLSRSGEVIDAGGGGMITIPDDPPVVALTFDDGPRDSTTARLLDGLALREVPATFFLVGERIPENEALVRRMAAEGHQVGVHSYSHLLLTDLSREDFDFEVAQTRTLLSSILGEEDFWLRPPYGIIDQSVVAWADSPVVLWSLDPEDWKDRDTRRIVNSILSRVEDGDILLFHDIYDSSVDAALQIIDELLQRGFTFATVEELVKARDFPTENGTIYRRIR